MAYPLTAINTCQLAQFQPWTDVYGMITNNPNGGSTGNGNLFTAHYVLGLVSTNQITDLEKQRILTVYSNNFSQSGILCRTPVWPGDRQAQDDIFGLMSSEAMISPDHRVLTRSIYNFGKIPAEGIDSTEPFQGAQTRVYWLIKILCFGRVKWVWNNIQPGKFDEASWLGRFPSLLAVMQMSLKEEVNPFFWLWWAVSCLSSAWFGNSSNNNGDCLELHGAVASQGYGKLTNWVCKQIHKGIKRKYGSCGGLMQVYFQDPSHPLVALLANTD
jgi:hypothetical protein